MNLEIGGQPKSNQFTFLMDRSSTQTNFVENKEKKSV